MLQAGPGIGSGAADGLLAGLGDLLHVRDGLGPLQGIQGLLLELGPDPADVCGVQVTDALHSELVRLVEGGQSVGHLLVEFESDLAGEGL
jgi:hypothetical protein